MVFQLFYNQAIRDNPDSKVHGANMGPIWGRQDQGGPHIGPMKFAIWDYTVFIPLMWHIYHSSMTRLW